MPTGKCRVFLNGLPIGIIEGPITVVDFTPEHTKRGQGAGEEIKAAYNYVDKVSDTCDVKGKQAWSGWALREAFLAGISYAEEKQR